MNNLPRHKWPPIQDEREHAAFIKILTDEGVRSYLEIGSMFGCSLWKVATALPKGSRIVCVDNMVDSPGARDSLADCIAELNAVGYDASWIDADSTNPATVALVRAQAPFDALFIDGCHAAEYVMADWTNYGPMARIVGFHDINWNSTWVGKRGNRYTESQMGVPKVWNEIKQGQRFKEFKYHARNNYYGIGVLWR
jgi:predicted O-methyltransferase YrrM